MLKTKVHKWFMEAVKLHPTADAELKLSIGRGGVRVNYCINNIVKEIEKANVILAPKKLFVTESTMQNTTYDMVNMFIIGAELEAKRRYESDLEKAARASEQSKAEGIENFLSGGTENEYSEAGLVNEGETKVKEAKH